MVPEADMVKTKVPAVPVSGEVYFLICSQMAYREDSPDICPLCVLWRH